jgi:hypothetical protein
VRDQDVQNLDINVSEGQNSPTSVHFISHLLVEHSLTICLLQVQDEAFNRVHMLRLELIRIQHIQQVFSILIDNQRSVVEKMENILKELNDAEVGNLIR